MVILRAEKHSAHKDSTETPRFSVSDESHAVTIKLDSGRLLLSLSDFDERPLQLFVNTPQGRVTLTTAGEYSVIVTNE